MLWGTSDFFGGLQARRIPALSVTLWSQVSGGLVLLVVCLAGGERPTAAGLAWGALAGVFGGMALLSFYRGLAVGAMSIVAPVSACGATVPVIATAIAGQLPDVVATVGIALALAGIVLVSVHPNAEAHPLGRPGLALGLALLAAAGFGMFYVLLHHAASAGASTLWPVLGVRAGSLALLLGLVVGGRRPAPWPGGRILLVATVGLLDTTANILWTVASVHGNLGIAAVLGSLYPVATVVLGRIVLDERLTPFQGTGVGLALLGVVLVSR